MPEAPDRVTNGWAGLDTVAKSAARFCVAADADYRRGSAGFLRHSLRSLTDSPAHLKALISEA